MRDFATYEPRLGSPEPAVRVATRAAVPTDTLALAGVMSVRGGVVEDYLDRAERLIARLPVLLIAEVDGVAAGWCGIQRYPIMPGEDPQWLVAGLTVVPGQRRRGIASQLLGDCLVSVDGLVRGVPVFSVVNAGNRASVDLHAKLGFIEVARAGAFAGIEFTGGEGVLLRRLALSAR